MSKSDLCWVIIRFIGITILIALANSVFLSVELHLAAKKITPSIGSEPSMFSVLRFTLQFLAGLFFLLDGRLIHRCLMSTSQEVHQPTSTPSHSKNFLNNDQLAEFDSWRVNTPGVLDLPTNKQVALFRSYKNKVSTENSQPD